MSAQHKNQNIRVYVRSRPLNGQERAQASSNVVTTDDTSVVLRERPHDKFTKTFTFDKVFGAKSKQVEVYRHVVMPLLEEVLLGYNCTVFAYGQTGTGKTYTMEGESSDNSLHWDQDPGMGIIPRTLSQLFDELRVQNCEFTVRVSFLELYNEELFDLLSPANDTSRLRIYEDSTRKGSCIIHGIEEVTVHNKNEVYRILQQGSAKRQTAATMMNAHSSRSHTVFSVTVHIKDNSMDGEELLKIGKLNLVDLAGSENIGRSGAVDRRAREAGNINQSLLTLGRVITSLVECTPHVPYRESKLTRLLQDSLGGRTKTSIIATVSPASCNVEETLSTLDYAHRAKKITNRPEINQKLTKKTLLKEYTAEIERLRRDLTATREHNGVFLAAENYDQLQAQIQEQEREIADKVGHIRALQQELDKLQSSFSSLEEESKERQAALSAVSEELRDTKESLESARTECDEQSHLVQRHVTTESKLSSQASQLVSVMDQATRDLNTVHTTLERKRHVESTNFGQVREFSGVYEQLSQQLSQQLQQAGSRSEQLQEQLRQQLADLSERSRQASVTRSQQLRQLATTGDEQLQLVCRQLEDDAVTVDEWSSRVVQLLADCGARQTDDAAAAQRLVTDMTDVFRRSVDTHAERATQHDQQLRTWLAQHRRGIDAASDQLRQLAEQLQQLEDSSSERQLLRQSVDDQQAQHAADEQIMQTMSERAEAFFASLTQDMQRLRSQRTTALATNTARIEAVTERVQQRHTAVNDITRQMGDSVRVVDANVEQDVVALTSTLQQFTTDVEAQVSTDKSSAAEKEADLLQTLAGHAESHSQTLSQIQADLLSRCHSVSTSERQHVQQLGSCARQLVDESQQADDNQQTAASALTNQLHALDDSTHQQLSDQLVSWREASTTAQETDQLVRQLYGQQLQPDQPSGETPARRQFPFTRYLAATSPHQRLLQRYRSAKQEQRLRAEEAESDSVVDSDAGSSRTDETGDSDAQQTAGRAAATSQEDNMSDASVESTSGGVENQAPIGSETEAPSGGVILRSQRVAKASLHKTGLPRRDRPLNTHN